MKIVSSFEGKLTPFQAYSAYLGLKMHFTQSYDWFKYHGRVNAKESTFETRRDRYSFVKLANKKDPIGLIVANLTQKPSAWVGDINSPEGEEIYKRWKKIQESLTYNFKEELKLLRGTFEDGLNVDDLLAVPKGEHPLLLKDLINGDVSLETVTMISSLFNFIPYWDKNIDEPVLWAEKKLLITKYKPFLEFDKVRVQEAFGEIIATE